jgi:predicted extracellular nuclease
VPVLCAVRGLLSARSPQRSRALRVCAGIAVAFVLAHAAGQVTFAVGAPPAAGDIIFNEYASDNDASGSDFVELLVLGDELDLRGLRISDQELIDGVLNTGESVMVLGDDAFLTNVPRGAIIAVWTVAAGVVTDTTIDGEANDWNLVLAPGTGMSILPDGLGGTSPGLNAGGEALYVYLPGEDGDSSGTDNVYLDFVSYEDDGGDAPDGLVDLHLPSVSDNAYYTGSTAADNDSGENWVRLSALGPEVTPGEPNPTQDLSGLRDAGGSGARVIVRESGGTTDVVEGGGADDYTIALSTTPAGEVHVEATAVTQTEVSLDGLAFGPSVTVILSDTSPAAVFVRAIDDAVVEPRMTVSVVHAITSSGDAAYSDELTPVRQVPVIVTDNDVLVTSIHDIQGPGRTSAVAGVAVTTRGIVFALKSNGFFIQEPDAGVDGDEATSEGIFVFTSAAPVVSRGDFVQVSGTVSEFVPGADPNQPPLTELTFATTSVLSSGHPLPAATVITAAMTTAANAVDLLERLEGMRVSVPSLTVVAPTQGFVTEPAATGSSNGVFYGVVSGVARPFREAGIEINDPLPASSPCCVPRFDGNPERLRIDSDAQPGAATLEVTTGVTVTGMIGPLDYGFRTYTVLPDAGSATAATPNIVAAPVPAPSAGEITVVGFNVFHFYDTVDDPGGEPVLTAAAFENRLRKASLAFRDILRVPDVVGVIEMENLSTLQTLASRLNADVVAAGGVNPDYSAHLVEGSDPGGIDVGFLVKGSRITVLSVTQERAAATFVDPTDGSVDLLHDRPPLVLAARALRPNGSIFDFVVIVNHTRSLIGVDDASDGPRVRAKRRAQAEDLANLIQEMQASNPSLPVIAIGDFNAFEINDGYVDSMGTIRGAPAPADEVVLASPDLVDPDMTNLASLLPAGRYSYSFDGNAQVLDHALVTKSALPWVSRFTYARLNADYPETTRSDPNRPERLSDHDASVTYLALGAPRLAGRIIAQTPRTRGQITVKLRISNRGGGNAGNVVLNHVVLKTLSGWGTVTTATPLPIALGDIAAGQSRTVTITLNVPRTVTRFSMTEKGRYTDAGAARHKLSMAQVVVRWD